MDKYYQFDEDTLSFYESDKPKKEMQKIANISMALTIIFGLVISVMTVKLVNYSDKNRVLSEQIRTIDKAMEEMSTEIHFENVIKSKIGKYAINPHKDVSQITVDSVASLLKELEVWYPDIIMAQIQIESNFGKSNVYSHSNNVLGMKKTNSRETTQIKGKDYNGYGVYNNWESSVIDRILWDYSVFGYKKPSRKDYLNKLDNIYGEASQYGDSVELHSQKYTKYF